VLWRVDDETTSGLEAEKSISSSHLWGEATGEIRLLRAKRKNEEAQLSVDTREGKQ